MQQGTMSITKYKSPYFRRCGKSIQEHCLFLSQNPKIAGYSVGEIAALCVAESITAEEGLSIMSIVSQVKQSNFEIICSLTLISFAHKL